METLVKYIKESIFDEEEIINKMDDIDKNAEYYKWYKLLTNPDTFADAFDKLWTMIGTEAKEVKKSHIPTLPQSNVYIVFQKNEYSLSRWARKYILKCFTESNTGRYAVSSIIGVVEADDNHKRKCIKYCTDFSGSWLHDILPRKSNINRMIARQIYIYYLKNISLYINYYTNIVKNLNNYIL